MQKFGFLSVEALLDKSQEPSVRLSDIDLGSSTSASNTLVILAAWTSPFSFTSLSPSSSKDSSFVLSFFFLRC